MSHNSNFLIIPYDWRTVPEPGDYPRIRLPLDLDDFARQLQEQCPAGEVSVKEYEDSTGKNTVIDLFIVLEKYNDERWWMVNFIHSDSDITTMEISCFPKRLAKQLMLWYRRMVPLTYPLYMMIPEQADEVLELTGQTTADDIEKFYPFPVPDD